MRNKKNKGIILITTMFFLTIVIMIMTLISLQGKAALQSGTASMQAEEAYMAALSGIEFVRGELRKEKAFGTEQFSTYTDKVENSGFPTCLFIKYDYPNSKDITGLIGATSENDYKAKFYISFANSSSSTSTSSIANYRHTSSACRYRSINNLNSASKIDKDMINGIRREVPAYGMYIVSKGVCGKAVRYAEAFVSSNGSVSIDGGTTIGGNIKIKGTDESYSKGTRVINEDGTTTYNGKNSLLTVSHINPKYAGQINAFEKSTGKCNKNIELDGKGKTTEDLLSLTNKVEMHGNFKGSSVQDDDLKENLYITKDSTVSVNDLESLDFDKAKANIDSHLNSLKLNEGSYIYYRNIKYNITNNSEGKTTTETQVSGKWVYLSNTNLDHNLLKQIQDGNYYTEPIKIINETENTPITLGIKDGTNDTDSRTVNVTGNVEFNNNVNFAIVDKIETTEVKNGNNNPKTKTSYEISNSTVDFQLSGGASVVSNGNLKIKGEVVGTGNLIALNNLEMNAGSKLEVDKNQKVAIWAGKDINISRPKNLSTDSLKNYFQNQVSNGGEVQNNNIVTGIVGNKVNEALGNTTVTSKIGDDGAISDLVIGVQVEGEQPSQYYFDYNGDRFFIRKDPGNPTKAVSIQKQGTTGWTEISDGDEDHVDTVYVSSRQTGESRSDFNIFIQKDGKYYYYTTVDFNQAEYNTRFASDCIGFMDGSAIKSDNFAGTTDNLNLSSVVNSLNNENAILSEAEVCENSLATLIANSDTTLQGTVYSKDGKIDISIGDTDFNIIGALITCDGDLNITAKHVNLTYNPDYVPFFSNIGLDTDVGFIHSFIGGE